MDKEHLLKIINNTLRKYSQIDFGHEQFESLFEPDYKMLPFGEQHIHTCLKFNHKEHGMIYKNGELSCTGLILHFTHERFEDISVNVFYDNYRKEIYNSVLAMPKYTKSDWQGRKNINQSAKKIMTDKELSNYFKRLFKRFECPVLA